MNKVTISSQKNFKKYEDVVFDYEGSNVCIKTNMTISEKKNFFDTVFNACWYEDKDGTYEYRYYLYEPMKRISFLMYFSNFVIPKNLEDLMDLVMNTPVWDAIYEHIPMHIKNMLDELDVYFDKKSNQVLKLTTDAAINSLIIKFNGLLDYINSAYQNLEADQIASAIAKLASLKDEDIIKTVK